VQRHFNVTTYSERLLAEDGKPSRAYKRGGCQIPVNISRVSEIEKTIELGLGRANATDQESAKTLMHDTKGQSTKNKDPRSEMEGLREDTTKFVLADDARGAGLEKEYHKSLEFIQ
jgi:hypothetical protein